MRHLSLLPDTSTYVHILKYDITERANIQGDSKVLDRLIYNLKKISSE